MTRDLTRLRSQPFDLLVIGGGIHGLAVAYDGAQRGLSVALIERHDLGGALSFNHAKTVHGSLRSLQSGDVAKARFSVHERRAMALIAPHLVTRLPFVIATTRKPTRSTMAMRAGFLLDSIIGFDRNDGLPERLHLPAGRVISRTEYRDLFGSSADQAATGGARWCDYHMPASDRLTLEFASAAHQWGAVLANYVEAVEPLTLEGRVRGVCAKDSASGQTFDIKASITVNAAGAHTTRWMHAFGTRPAFPLLKAMNLVTTRPAGLVAIGAPTTGGRLLLIMPWQGCMVVGTSHSDAPVDADDSTVDAGELDGFLGEVNDAFPALKLVPSDVSLVHRGVVPGQTDWRGRLGLMGHHRIVDHAVDGVHGAISVVGVKYTTARGVGQQVVDLVGRKLGRTLPRCRTGIARLPGALIESVTDESARAAASTVWSPSVVAHVVSRYGAGWRALADLCRADPDLADPISPGLELPRAVVVHGVRHEMACTLSDVVIRRIGIGAAGYAGDDAVQGCATVMAGELGWTAARVAEEVAAVRAFYTLAPRRRVG